MLLGWFMTCLMFVWLPMQQVNGATLNWSNITGNFSTGYEWGGTAPTGTDATATLVFGGGGPAYIATDDLIGLSSFQLNQITLNNLTTLADAIAGTPALNFSTSATPTIQQNGLGAFTISSAITLGNNGLTIGGTGPGLLTLSGLVTGTATSNALTLSGFNTTVLSNAANTFTGNVLINSGALSVATDGTVAGTNTPLGALTNSITFGSLGGGILAMTGTFGTLNASRSVTFTGNGTIDVATSATIAGTLSGAGNMFKQNAGTLTLTGTNNTAAAGATYINGGTISIASDANLLGTAASNVNFGGGALLNTGATSTTARNVQDYTAGTISSAAATQLTMTGVISGSGALTFGSTGNTGTVVLNGAAANTYTGGTTIAAGTVTESTASQFGSGALASTGGILNINANQTVTNFSGAAASATLQTLFIGNGATLTDLGITGANSASNQTFSGIIGNGGTGSLVYGAAGVATTGTLTLNPAISFATTALTAANGSTITVASTAGLVIGMPVTGTGIPAGDTIATIPNATTFTLTNPSTAGVASGAALTYTLLPTVTFATTALTAVNGSTITVASTVGLAAGMPVSGTGIPAGATIAAITSGTTYTLSTPSTAGVATGASLTYNNGNTFTGGITINSGVVAFGSDATMGGASSGTVLVNSGGTAAANSAIDQTFVTNVASAASASNGVIALGLNSANNLTFAAANLANASLGATGAVTYSGTLTPNGTTYRLGGGTAAGVLTVSSALTGSGNSLAVNVNGTSSLSQVILSNAGNTFTGITITNGTLSVGAVGNLGATTETITINGGALLGNANLTTAAGQSFTMGGGAINAANGTTLTLAGAVGGANLNINSNANGTFQTGTVVLNVASTYTGTTTVNAGALSMGATVSTINGTNLVLNSNNAATTFNTFNNAGAGTGPLTIGNLSGSFLSGIGSAITLSLSANALTINETSNTTFNGAITGITSGTGANNSRLVLAGTNTLTLTGLNTFGGSATAYAGAGLTPSIMVTGTSTLSVGRDSSLGTVPSAVTANSIVLNNASANAGATLNAFQSTTISANRGLALGPTTAGTGNSGTLSASAGAILTYNGIVANDQTAATAGTNSTSNLNIAGPGTVFLGGVNTFGGTGATVNLNSGTLSILLDTALGNASNTLTFNGGSLRTTAALGLADSRAITLSASGGTVNVAGSSGVVPFSGVYNQNTYNVSAVGTPNLVTMASNVVQFPPASAYTLNATTLSGVISGAGGTLTVNGGTISNAIGTTFQSNGTLILSGTNTFTGSGGNGTNQVTIAGGVLSIGADLNLGAVPTVANQNALNINNGATLLTSATLTLATNRGITLGGTGGVIDAPTGVTTTYAGVIAGTALTKIDAGTLALTGAAANTFTGALNLNGGIVSITADNLLGSGGASNVLNFNGGQLTTVTNAISDARNINLVTGGTINLGNTVTLSGTISGPGAFTRGTGAFALTLSGTNTYTGPTFTGTNSLIVSADNNLGATTGGTGFIPGAVIFNVAGGTLNTTANITTSRAFDFLTNNTLTANTGTTLTINGNVAVASGVTLTINNTTSGATTFGGGLFFNPTSTFTITNGAVTLNAANELPFNGTTSLNGAATAALQLAGKSQILGGLTTAASSIIQNSGAAATLTIGQSASTTAAGIETGSINLIKVGTSTLTLTGGGSTFSGTITVAGGTLSFNAAQLRELTPRWVTSTTVSS